MLVVREQVALAGYTTLRLGGPAARFAEADTEHEIVAAVRDADLAGEPVLLLGGGSNLVVADAGFPGTVVRLASRGVAVTGSGDDVRVGVQAGENWDQLVDWAVAEKLSGFECLAGIPGLAGATPIQNVGAYGQEVATVIEAVRVYDRTAATIATLTGAECGFGYRTSLFKITPAGHGLTAAGRASESGGGTSRPAGGTSRLAGGTSRLAGGTSRLAGGTSGLAGGGSEPTGRYVVLDVTFRLRRTPMSAPLRYPELAAKLGVALDEHAPLADVRAAVIDLRRGKGMVLDPADPDTNSAGSFFTNPVLDPDQSARLERMVARRFGPDIKVPRFPADRGRIKVPAGWLIEQAGFARGYPGGGAARISSKHTLALTNPGRASTGDLIDLARQIVAGVRSTFGVELTNEPVLVGVTL